MGGRIELRRDNTPIDEVIYGEHASGTTALYSDRRTLGRGLAVDTNNQTLDWIQQTDPTPGAPNDRACQSAVPLYEEELY